MSTRRFKKERHPFAFHPPSNSSTGKSAGEEDDEETIPRTSKHQSSSENDEENLVNLQNSSWTPEIRTVIKLLLSARLCSVVWSHITDCDETFNYWEPLHYVLYHRGFQTWEYSPKYAIRSYAYILLHLFPLKIYDFFFHPDRLLIFYLLRLFLAVTSVGIEGYFYHAVLRRFGSNFARFLLVFQLFAPGFFISTTAFLPSSFAMSMTTLAFAFWFSGRDVLAITAVACSGLLGWPFAGILGVPIALDIIKRRGIVFFITRAGFLVGFPFVSIIVGIDSNFYGKIVFPSLNIILYNVISGNGPELYGIEPWYFYLINGFLNFNIGFFLALFCPFVVAIDFFFRMKKNLNKKNREKKIIDEKNDEKKNNEEKKIQEKKNIKKKFIEEKNIEEKNVEKKFTEEKNIQEKKYIKKKFIEEKNIEEKNVEKKFTEEKNFEGKNIFVVGSCFSVALWFGILFSTPHKEERFLFPVYSLLIFLASFTLEFFFRTGKIIFSKFLKPDKVKKLSSGILLLILIIFSLLGTSRMFALSKFYAAPMEIYTKLHLEAANKTINNNNNNNKIDNNNKINNNNNINYNNKIVGGRDLVNLCVGKEWYRFPSSFFLPDQWQLQFIQSDFKGILPKAFAPYPEGLSVIPTEMNDENREEPTRYLDVCRCDYLVDLTVEGKNSLFEPSYEKKKDEWTIVHKEKFLNNELSNRIFRAFYVPFLSEKFCQFNDYVFLRRKRKCFAERNL